MTRRMVLPLALVVLLLGAMLYIRRLKAELNVARRGGSAPAATAAAPTPTPAAPATPGQARTLTPEQRQGMLDVLGTESGPVRKVWFRVELNKPEPSGYQKEIEAVFKQAGWEVETAGSDGMVFKPGVYLLVGDDEWPSYASTAYDAFQKAGIEVKAARGYRAYYQEQKKEKPAWQGPKLAEDQTYVVLIGASPPS